MKNILILILISFSITINAQHEGHTTPTKKAEARSVSYTCPMHPEIHSPKPGKCPKCGMNLVKEKIKAKPANAKPKSGKAKSQPAAKTEKDPESAYSCPMHPEVISDKPGNCPKCGMKLEKKVVDASPIQ